MTNVKKKVWLIAGATLLVVAAVLIGLFSTGNLFGTPSEPDYAAYLKIDGEETYYMTASEAWSAIPLDKYCEMYLLKDWLADSQGNMGYGTGFSNGIIVVRERSTNLNLYLNGHNIDRGLYDPSRYIDNPRDAGSVFYFCADATFAIHNGTIRGGNAKGEGGGIFFGGDSDGRLRLYHVTLTSNKAKRGSAISFWNGTAEELTLDNVTITGNYCTDYCGGAVYTTNTSTTNGFYLHNKVIIKDNSGRSSCGNNISLQGGIREANTLSSDSEIYLYKPDSTEFTNNVHNVKGATTLAFKGQADYFNHITSVVKAENGYFEIGDLLITQNNIYFHHN